MRLSYAELVALAQRHGFPDPQLAASVAEAESGGDACAQGDPNVGTHPCDRPNGASQSFGLWQVSTLYNPQYDATSLLDPDYNARAAYAISSSGTNWRPWSTAWDDAAHRVGYLGARAPFRLYYHPMTNPPTQPNPLRGETVRSPARAPSAGAVVVVGTVILLASAAGLAADRLVVA